MSWKHTAQNWCCNYAPWRVKAKTVKGYEEAVCWPTGRFHARHMSIHMTLELETSQEIARRPRQNHWSFDNIASACCLPAWTPISRNYSSYTKDFAVCNGFSSPPWGQLFIHSFFFLCWRKWFSCQTHVLILHPNYKSNKRNLVRFFSHAIGLFL